MDSFLVSVIPKRKNKGFPFARSLSLAQGLPRAEMSRQVQDREEMLSILNLSAPLRPWRSLRDKCLFSRPLATARSRPASCGDE